MDEPTGDLDTKNTEYIINLLLKLNLEKKITMIMVTHDEYMKQYASRIFSVTDGKINKMMMVDQNVRENAIVKLREQLKSYEDGDGGVRVRMGAESNADNANKLTETRKVQDYPFIKYIVNKLAS